MRRRELLGSLAAASGAFGGSPRRASHLNCGCALAPGSAAPPGSDVAAGIRMAPHACEGPIGGIASLHVDAAIPNFLAQEICGFVQAREMNRVWEDLLGFPAMRMVDGRFPADYRTIAADSRTV